MEIDPIIFHRRLPPIRIDTVGRSITIRSLSISLPLPPSQEEYISISLVVDDVPFFSGLILCGFGFVVSLVPDYELQLRHLPPPPTTTQQLLQLNSVRPPAHNPYYVTSHAAAAQAAAAAAAIPTAAATGPFVDVVGHQAQSTIAVPVMPPGAGRSLHYHTHAATHALPQQPPLTYPNWVPFTHFG